MGNGRRINGISITNNKRHRCLIQIRIWFVIVNFNNKRTKVCFQVTTNCLYRSTKYRIKTEGIAIIKIFYWLAEKLDALFLKSKKTAFNKLYVKFIIFVLGRNYFTGFNWDYENYLQNLSLDTFDEIILDRFFFSYLFIFMLLWLFMYLCQYINVRDKKKLNKIINRLLSIMYAFLISTMLGCLSFFCSNKLSKAWIFTCVV